MAERVKLDGSVYVERSPIGAWLLTVVTLLVYFFVWYYKVNDETRRYLRDDSIRPWHSVFAIFPGVLLVVPYFVSLYRTAERIRLVEERSGSPKRIRPGLGTLYGFLTLLTVLLMGGCLFYYQDHLNKAWTAASRGGESISSVAQAAKAS
jgi:Domain of unknown function (DUF4234)